MSRKQSFLTGAIILMVANIISKVLGAVFKIPLTYILGEEGMAIFNTAFQVYIMLLSFIISGLPFAISKLVAEEEARGREGEVHKIVTVSTVLLIVLGIIGSLALYFGAPFWAYAMKDEKAVFAIQLLAPSVFFVALGTSYKSFYQGAQNMIPTAVSQVVESFVKLAAGYVCAMYLLSGGIARAAGGAVFGVTVGEIVATFILVLLYFPNRPRDAKKKAASTSRKIMGNLMVIALPLLLASVVSNVLSLIDISLIRSQLMEIRFTPESAAGFLGQYGGFTKIFDSLTNTLRIDMDGARWLYGAYSGYALTIFHLPVGILATFGVSILPVIAGALAVGNKGRAQMAASMGFRITMLATLPCAVIVYLYADKILNVLFHNAASAQMLRLLSPCIVMICMGQLAASVLQSAGKIGLSFWYMLVGCILKLIGNVVLIRMPELNINGAVLSADISYGVLMLLNLWGAGKTLGLKYNLMEILIKPVISSLVMGGFMYCIQMPVASVCQNNFLYLAIVSTAGLAVYALMLLLTNAISVREMKTVLKRA